MTKVTITTKKQGDGYFVMSIYQYGSPSEAHPIRFNNEGESFPLDLNIRDNFVLHVSLYGRKGSSLEYEVSGFARENKGTLKIGLLSRRGRDGVRVVNDIMYL